ncbi:GTPase IMAP family member 9-like [Crassostrea virginica]
MEKKTIESFLKSIGLETYIGKFKGEDIEMETLIDLPDDLLNKILEELKLNLGTRLKIKKELKKISPEKSSYSTASQFYDEEIRIVLLGKTGCGKSATGNSIFGKRRFISHSSASSVTRTCCFKTEFRFNKKIVIVDTPGFFDTKQSNKIIQDEISKCITLSSPGPHAFILVLSISNRFTEEEQQTIEQFVNQFGNDVYKYFIVLFTRKEDLDRDNVSLVEHIRKSPVELINFIEKCGKRAVAFDNTLKDEASERQVKELLDLISQNVAKNGGRWYTDQMFKEAEEDIKKMEEKKMKETEEKRKEELKAIEERIEGKYSRISEIEKTKLMQVQNELENLHQSKREKEKEVEDLRKNFESFKKQHEMSSGEERERFQQTLDSLTQTLTATIEAQNERTRKIEELQEAKDKSEEIYEEIRKIQLEERERAKLEYTKIEREKARDDVKEYISENGFFSSLVDFGIKIGSKLLDLLLDSDDTPLP